jgi:hypothetical protein
MYGTEGPNLWWFKFWTTKFGVIRYEPSVGISQGPVAWLTKRLTHHAELYYAYTGAGETIGGFSLFLIPLRLRRRKFKARDILIFKHRCRGRVGSEIQLYSCSVGRNKVETLKSHDCHYIYPSGFSRALPITHALPIIKVPYI